jgi:hypothetical protein
MITKNKFSLQKWFSTEFQALSAFSQKKITLHTPILVRYPSFSFQIKKEKNKILFLDTSTNFKINQKEIILYKSFQIGKNQQKFYFLTNLGVLIARFISENTYQLTDCFLETTPGRVIFSLNFKNSIKK